MTFWGASTPSAVAHQFTHTPGLMSSTPLPSQGFVFWPVGTGDSTTVVVRNDDSGDADVVLQIDLHDLHEGDGDTDGKYTPMVDRLVELLPQRDGKPYLSTFILTHPDKDHILGFESLLDAVEIDEIWHTPRIFQEYHGDGASEPCADAKAFQKEVERRRDVTIRKEGKDIPRGDRVRIIGHDSLFDEEPYKSFPKSWRHQPGNKLEILDGEDLSDRFTAFVLAPFKDTCEADQNNSSLALHVKLTSPNGEHTAQGLFFGDLSYDTLKRIVEKTRSLKNEEYLAHHTLLAPHHVSKTIMYKRIDGEDVLQKDPEILKEFEKEQLDPAYVVASAEPPFETVAGRNPPHQKARSRYEEVVEKGHFLCTHEHGDEDSPERIEFALSDTGLTYTKPGSDDSDGDGGDDSDSGGGGGGPTAGDAARRVRQSATPAVHTGYGAPHHD